MTSILKVRNSGPESMKSPQIIYRIYCYHGTECIRKCWTEHDQCQSNCPCNEECPRGCSEVRNPNHMMITLVKAGSVKEGIYEPI